MHLPDIDGVIAGGLEVLNPGVTPSVSVLEDTVGVRIEAREEARATRSAGGRRNKTVAKRDTLTDQPVQIRRIHVRKPDGVDGVKALLVGEDEDDIGAGLGHCGYSKLRLTARERDSKSSRRCIVASLYSCSLDLLPAVRFR